MDTNQRLERPSPDPHFERLHGAPLNYARSIQSFLQTYDPKPATFPTEASGFSYPTVPDAVDFTKGKADARNVPALPAPTFLSGFQTPYGSTCSIVNCESGCNPSVFGSGKCSLSQCNNLDRCTSEECCREPACLDHISLPTTRRESIDFSGQDQYASPSSQHPITSSGKVFPAYSALPGIDDTTDDPFHCDWLLPGEECDITGLTDYNLSQDEFYDHIQSETSLDYGSSNCVEPLIAQQPSQALWNSDYSEEHVPDLYVCLWDACMDSFPDAEQLERHMEVSHTQMESIDCRWGGCGTITANSAKLQSHVSREHLQIHNQQTGSLSDPKADASDNHSSQRRNHPLYWTPEDDDLLMRVRAQNLTFPQIAMQFFPEKSAKACSCRYARLHIQQEQLEPQPTEQSTPLLSYTPLQPASPFPSPYESTHSSVDPCLIQASPATLSNYSSQLVLDRPQLQATRKCKWITDDTTSTLCEARFENPNELQAHIESSHYPFSDKRKRRPNSHWVCKWSGCALKGETRKSRDKLSKHVCTHTGCKSTSVVRPSLQ